MKDARGHGSNGRGVKLAGRTNPAINKAMAAAKKLDAANAASWAATDETAARAMGQGHPKSEGVGPHSAMAGSRDYDSFGRPRDELGKSEYDEASRDMALRARNGHIGRRGM